MEALSNALKISLDTWGRNSPTYGKTFKKIPRECFAVAHAGLEEMKTPKPGSWEVWWTTNHMRFVNSFRQKDLILVHEIMYNFLTALARGELRASERRDDRKETHTTGKTKARS